MVKQLNITLDDEDFKKLKNLKGIHTWRTFIKELINNKGGKNVNNQFTK